MLLNLARVQLATIKNRKNISINMPTTLYVAYDKLINCKIDVVNNNKNPIQNKSNLKIKQIYESIESYKQKQGICRQ